MLRQRRALKGTMRHREARTARWLTTGQSSQTGPSDDGYGRCCASGACGSLRKLAALHGSIHRQIRFADPRLKHDRTLVSRQNFRTALTPRFRLGVHSALPM